MDPTKEQHQCFHKSQKKSDGDPGLISQVFREESMRRTWAFERHVRFRIDRKRQAVKSKDKSMLIILRQQDCLQETVKSAYNYDVL
jgi:hypothetical protein